MMNKLGRLGRGVCGAVAAAVVLAGAPVSLPAAAAPAAAAPAAAGDVKTTVTYVVDGDTIHARIGGKVEKIRVIGVDTPEVRTCYAAEAKSATTKLVYRKTVVLRADKTQPNRDKHGRLLRHVVLADSTKLAQRLISNGFGKELTVGKPYVGQPTYRKAQATAKAKKRGLWKACGSTAVRTKPAPKPASNTCKIKGNIASDGEKIYHVPGQKYYNATKIDTRKGERWFCSAADARRAGWRAAKV